MRSICVALVPLVFCAAAPSHAGVWEWIDVYQPLLLNGLTAEATPYQVRIWPYAQRVEMTSWENLLYRDGEWLDANAASLFGVSVRLDTAGGDVDPSDSRGKGVFGDTLRVVVETGEASPGEWPESMLRRVVVTTIECVRLNAAASWPRPRYTDVRVVGRPEFAELSSVFEVPREETAPASDEASN